MGEVARRRLFFGHPVLRQWTPRRSFAVAVFVGLLLLIVANIDPRVRAGIRYARPPSRYTMPVSGVDPSKVVSTWHATRSGGRKHEGADIFAARGTAVVSATDGMVWDMGRNDLGGNVVYVLGEGLALYYYAHLDTWAPDLAPGDHIKAGRVLGSVGNSGNAARTAAHLHFGVTRLSMWGARTVDPVTILAGSKVVPTRTLANGTRTPPAKKAREILTTN